MAIYFERLYQNTSNACVVDLTAPVFLGITTLVAQPNGSLRATWSAGTDVSVPVQYNIYIQATSATGLFSPSNETLKTTQLTKDIFQLANGGLLLKDTVYFVGVRCVDAVGNEETNVVSLSATSIGVLDDSLVSIANSLKEGSYWSRGVFAIDQNNNFTGSLWIALREQVLTTSLGTASYSVYDNNDVAVPGLTQTGITPNGNGVFVITPVSAVSLDPFINYRVKITITYNSIQYMSYKGFTIGE